MVKEMLERKRDERVGGPIRKREFYNKNGWSIEANEIREGKEGKLEKDL